MWVASSQYGSSFAIVVYVVICALISLVSAAVLRDRTTEDIDVDVDEVPVGATAPAGA